MRHQREECSLADLLDDPVVGLVMKSDGVDRDCVERLFAEIDHTRFTVADAAEG